MTGGSLSADVRFARPGFSLEAVIEAAPSELVAILGPNGSGKSTLLDLVAGHLVPAAGEIRIGSRVLAGPDVRPLEPARRRVGLLRQRGLVFPHLTALDNVAFGPRAQGVRTSTARARARDWLERVGLAGFERRRPSELSGGQAQRVALARTLAAGPDALLLDEPFAALDIEAAADMRRLVRAHGRALGIPILLVTHDPLDAVVLADRAVILQDGRVVDQGSVARTLGRPSTTFAAALAGVNLVFGEGSGGAVRTERGLVLRGEAPGDGAPIDGRPASAAFAPGAVHVRPADPPAHEAGGDAGRPNHWRGRVSSVEPARGGVRILVAEHPDVAAEVPTAVAVGLDLEPGSLLDFSVEPGDVSLRRLD